MLAESRHAALKVEEDGRGDTPGNSNPYSDNESAKGEANDGDAEDKIDGKDDSEKSTADLYHLKVHAASGRAGRGDDMGILHQEEDDVELPEDKFHRADASSSYYISQREQAVKDKWEKAEKEREERKKNPDPNVEYIDMDDFKPGGKMTPAKKGEEMQKEDEKAEVGSNTLKKAASVVVDKAAASLEGLSLSNNMWTELLD